MERLHTSLLLLLIFCSSCDGKTYWTHLGTRCVEDCNAYWGAYMCKTIDKEGKSRLMYCSPQENTDYLARKCTESSKCGKHGNDLYLCKIDLVHWGYCGLVTEDKDYYGSYYGALCYDHCEQRGMDYYWCHTVNGWDYCSPSENTDYMNRQCKAGRPCEKYNSKFNWCEVEGSWGYCGLVEPKMFIHLTKANEVCIDQCQYYQSKGYYYCHTANSWDYCSPEVGVTYKGKPCSSDISCGLHGKDYNWCYTSGSEYDYCGPIKPGQCTYIPSSHGRTNNNGTKTIEMCTKVDNGNKITTNFSAMPDPHHIANGSQFRAEIEKIISQWDNGYLVGQPTSNMIRSTNVRIDVEKAIIRHHQRYYNLQVRWNVKPPESRSITFSQVLMPCGVPARYIRNAFQESFWRRARVFIDVTATKQR